MVKLQLASSPAAEPLATSTGNPSGFLGSGRAHAVHPSITPLLVFTPGAACSLKQHSPTNSGGPKYGNPVFLLEGRGLIKGQALTGMQMFYLFFGYCRNIKSQHLTQATVQRWRDLLSFFFFFFNLT